MGLFGWLKKAPEIKKAEFVSPATGKIIPIDQVLLWNLQMVK